MGYKVDLDKWTVSVPDEKLAKMRRIGEKVLASDRASIRDLAKWKGQVCATRYASPFSTIFTSSFNRFMSAQFKLHGVDVWKKVVSVPSDLSADVAKWIESANSLTVTTIAPLFTDSILWVDTSDTQVGAHCRDRVTAIPLPPDLRGESSTCRELFGLWAALKARTDLFANKSIRVYMDSLSSVCIFTRRGTKIARMDEILRWIADALALADRVSKAVDRDEWIFNPSVMTAIIRSLSLPLFTIDCFATANSNIANRYMAAYDDSTCVAKNFFAQKDWPWHGEWAFLNPPFSRDICEQTVEKAAEWGIRGVLCLPFWPNRAFWEPLMQMASKIVKIPRNPSTFISAHFNAFFRETRWDTVIAVVDKPPSTHPPSLYEFNWSTNQLKPVQSL